MRSPLLETWQRLCETGNGTKQQKDNDMTTPNTSPDALEAALRPFASEAAELADGIPDDCHLSYDGFPQLGLSDFTVGDLRKAKQALAAEKRAAQEGVTDAFTWDFIGKLKNAGAQEDASENGMFWCVDYIQLRAALQSVWSVRGEDAKDAARYRWLKKGCKRKDELLAFVAFHLDVDASIDAAMQATDHE